MRWIALVSLIVSALPAHACSFCGPPSGQSTLREQLAKAAAVVFGTLKNPQLGADPTTGTTELHVKSILKSHAVVEKRPVIVLAKYLPVAADKADVVAFIADHNGKPDSLRTPTSNVAVAAYLQGVAKLDPQDVPARLAFAFQHLDAADETVSADAYLEFAKANDADILKSKERFDAAKLRALVKDPKMPGNRLGVFALLLGLCGEKADATLLVSQIPAKLNERTITALGGLLTGIVLQDPDTGFKLTGRYLTESQQNYAVRLGAFSTVRYLQEREAKASREPILAIYRELLDDHEMADMAMEDLRRWKWWDHTAAILKLYGQPGYQAKGMRNAILRYALGCPEPEAKAFVDAMRKQDAAWVRSVEELMKALE
jgi:hypothetical protein